MANLHFISWNVNGLNGQIKRTACLDFACFCVFFSNALILFIKLNIGSVGDPRILWDAIKGSIRDSSISFSSHRNKSRLLKINELEGALAQLEARRQSTQTDALLAEISATITELNSVLRRRAEFLMHRVRRTYYFN